jgi:hypothetical protein
MPNRQQRNIIGLAPQGGGPGCNASTAEASCRCGLAPYPPLTLKDTSSTIGTSDAPHQNNQPDRPDTATNTWRDHHPEKDDIDRLACGLLRRQNGGVRGAPPRGCAPSSEKGGLFAHVNVEDRMSAVGYDGACPSQGASSQQPSRGQSRPEQHRQGFRNAIHTSARR